VKVLHSEESSCIKDYTITKTPDIGDYMKLAIILEDGQVIDILEDLEGFDLDKPIAASVLQAEALEAVIQAQQDYDKWGIE